MTKQETQRLPLGLYEIFWKGGGSSFAAVGNDKEGKRWYAPINWITVPGKNWKVISHVKKIR